MAPASSYNNNNLAPTVGIRFTFDCFRSGLNGEPNMGCGSSLDRSGVHARDDVSASSRPSLELHTKCHLKDASSTIAGNDSERSGALRDVDVACAWSVKDRVIHDVEGVAAELRDD
jgi:hypothetical protein